VLSPERICYPCAPSSPPPPIPRPPSRPPSLLHAHNGPPIPPLAELQTTLEKEFGPKNVHEFDVQVPRWVRGKESCTLVSPKVGNSSRNIDLLGLGFSVGTNSAIEAEVVVVGSLTELVEKGREQVEGKIVVFDMPYEGYGRTRPFRTHCASFSAKFGARALLLRSVASFSLNTPHTGAMSYLSGCCLSFIVVSY